MPKTKKIDVNQHVGQRLRARRLALGLSLETVGQAMNVASQQVQKYEKGVNAMNARRLYEFALFLKVPMVYFFDGLAGLPASSGLEIGAGGASRSGQGEKAASDRESLEILKSFRRIKDYGLRKRVADLLRSLSLLDI